MTIAEFAKKRDIDQQTVYKYIRRHPDQFTNHVTGRPMQLDDEALRILSSVYPQKNPVEVIEDIDAYKQLVEAQKTILKLQEQIHAYDRLKADYESSQRLLDQRDHDNTWLKEQIDKLQIEAERQRKKAEEAIAEANEAKKEADHIRNRGFWARIFNK